MGKYDKIRSEIRVVRKPYDMEDDVPKNFLKDISPEINDLIDELDIIDGNNLDFENGDGFFEDFLDGNVQFFIVEIGDRRFFVDTQGYTYARYVGEIIK